MNWRAAVERRQWLKAVLLHWLSGTDPVIPGSVAERADRGVSVIAVGGAGVRIARVATLEQRMAARVLVVDPDRSKSGRGKRNDMLAADFGRGLQCLLVAGLGGRTGSALTPVLAARLRALGVPTHAFLTWPFHFENRTAVAREALGRLRQSTTSISLFHNDSLLDGEADDEVFDRIFLERAVVACAEYHRNLH